MLIIKNMRINADFYISCKIYAMRISKVLNQKRWIIFDKAKITNNQFIE